MLPAPRQAQQDVRARHIVDGEQVAEVVSRVVDTELGEADGQIGQCEDSVRVCDRFRRFGQGVTATVDCHNIGRADLDPLERLAFGVGHPALKHRGLGQLDRELFEGALAEPLITKRGGLRIRRLQP